MTDDRFALFRFARFHDQPDAQVLGSRAAKPQLIRQVGQRASDEGNASRS
jgi:hypothetical protein